MTFVVVRTGVFDQGVCAVEDDITDAFDSAEYYASKERDTYHEFEIRTIGNDNTDLDRDEEYAKVLYKLGTFNPITRTHGRTRLWFNMQSEAAREAAEE